MHRFKKRIAELGLLLMILGAPLSAQEVDGLVQQPDSLVGQDIVVQPLKGTAIDGRLSGVVPSQKGQSDVLFLEVERNGKTKKVKSDQVASLKLGGRSMILRLNPRTKSFHLVDVDQAHAAVDNRLKKLGKARREPIDNAEFDALTKKCMLFADSSVKQLGNGFSVSEGSNVILITDYPPQQSKGLVRALDQMIPTLKSLFGVGRDVHVLPGKPIIGAFGVRSNLGRFQSEIVKHNNYGTIRAFFQVVDEHVVISAEDDRSVQHMLWQAAWGLSGAFASYSYSNAELPLWLKVGLQQHCGDVLVKGVTNHAQEKDDVTEELRSSSLNGILNADNLPGQRQLVCKLIAAHLYQANPVAFGQMLEMLKQGRSTNEVLNICYGIDQRALANSFGKSISIPGLSP